MIKKRIDIGVSSLLCATMEGAVGAKVAELGLTVVGASVAVMWKSWCSKLVEVVCSLLLHIPWTKV